MRSKTIIARAGAGLLAAAIAGSTLAISTGPVSAAVQPRKVTATYSCSASVVGTTQKYTGTVKISGTTPKTAKPGAAVSMTGFQLTVTVPVSIVNEAAKYVKSVTGKLTTVDINASDAKARTVNAAGKGIAIPKTGIVKNKALNITLPAKAITVGTWSASKAGTMTFTSGSLKFTLTAVVFGSPVNVPVSCTPKPAATISKTVVS